MLTKESIQHALDIRAQSIQSKFSTEISADDIKFFNEQVRLSNELIKLANIDLNDGFDVYYEHLLKIALFLVDDQRVKDWSTRLNNKAFW